MIQFATSVRPSHRSRRRRGAVIVLLAVLLPVLLILAAYAINIAYIEAATAEVQIAVDAAAQAAGRAYIRTGDESAALSAAKESAARNPVSGQIIPFSADDLEFGSSRRDSLESPYVFSPLTNDALGNAVRVSSRSLQSADPPVLSPIFPTLGSGLAIRPLRTAVSTQGTLDVSLVLDRSGSMAYASDEDSNTFDMPAHAPAGWQFGDPVPPRARWLDTVAAVDAFLRVLDQTPQTERLSLSTYATETSTGTMLTDRYPEVIAGMHSISQSFTGGGTAIGQGMTEGLAAMTDPERSRPYAIRVMVLMTDGQHNTGHGPESAAWHLRKNGVTLFTVTFSDFAVQNRMRRVARSCGGEHFHATDAAQLQAAFEEIAHRFPSLLTE